MIKLLNVQVLVVVGEGTAETCPNSQDVRDSVPLERRSGRGGL